MKVRKNLLFVFVFVFFQGIKAVRIGKVRTFVQFPNKVITFLF